MIDQIPTDFNSIVCRLVPSDWGVAGLPYTPPRRITTEELSRQHTRRLMKWRNQAYQGRLIDPLTGDRYLAFDWPLEVGYVPNDRYDADKPQTRNNQKMRIKYERVRISLVDVLQALKGRPHVPRKVEGRRQRRESQARSRNRRKADR